MGQSILKSKTITIIGNIGAVVHFLSGFVADLCGALVWTPMDIIKQRQVEREGEREREASRRDERKGERGERERERCGGERCCGGDMGKRCRRGMERNGEGEV
jgi:hypothetical protein